MARLDPDLPDPLPKGGANRTIRLLIAIVVVLLLLGFLLPRIGSSPLGPPPAPTIPN